MTKKVFENSSWAKSDDIVRRKGPKCGDYGGKRRDGFPCKQPAGWKTKHTGVGLCNRHGGANQTLAGMTKKEGLATAIAFPGIQEEYNRLSQNDDVFNLRDHIHLIEAISITYLKRAQTLEDLPMVVRLISEARKTVQALDEIEHGRRLVIELPELRLLLDTIKEIIFRHVLDSHTRSLIAEDLLALPVGRTGDTDQSSGERQADSSRLEVES